MKKLFHSFDISKTIISKLSVRALIGQNYSRSSYWTNFSCDLKGWKWPDWHILLGDNSRLMDINCNALSKLFADCCNLSLPALGAESLKLCCYCNFVSFVWEIFQNYIDTIIQPTNQPTNQPTKKSICSTVKNTQIP